MTTRDELVPLLRHPVRFEVADEPAKSHFVIDAPDGEHQVSAFDAVGPLSQGIRLVNAHASVRAWATPAIIALRLMTTGHLLQPPGSSVDQLRNAGNAIGPDAGSGQKSVFAFLEALAVDAPTVATTPQEPAPRTVLPRQRETTFSYAFEVTFLETPTDTEAAVVRLRIIPRAQVSSPFDASELTSGPERPIVVDAREPTREMLERVARWWEPAARLAEPHARGGVTVGADALAELGSSRLTATLLANRIDVRWPESLVRQLDTRAVLRADESPRHDRPAAFTHQQLFRFNWQVAVGDQVLSEAEVEQLARDHRAVIRLRDSWVMVDRAKLQRALHGGSTEVRAGEALRAVVTGEMLVDGRRTVVETVGWLDDVRRRLSTMDRDLVAAHQPDALSGALRDYQLQGLRWMSQLTELGLGGCLADDMGLGKTVMLIALQLHRAERAAALGVPHGPTLVVCPASVIGNWEREVERFAPDAEVHRFHGPRRSLATLRSGFVITTYATMVSSAAELSDIGWDLVVADEAQNVKNPRTKAARVLRGIEGLSRLALTGTPVENHLGELWSILDWTTPGLLGSWEEFRATWSRPIESGREPHRAAELAELVQPFVLRRRKTDPGIAPELPPKIETDYRANLTREQIGLYEAAVRETMAEIEAAEGMKRRQLVVTMLTRLKQICNHPAHFLREADGKLEGRSGKLAVFDELLEEIVDEGRAALVFTQYTTMGHLLTRHLTDLGMSHRFLHGGTGVRQRERMVEDFQAGEFNVFVLSLKAAGTGLNLTRADHVIHYDRWWNPAVEDQATDRAHRIGQTRAVHVHRLVSEGTIEESIAELITSKRALADAVVNAGETALTELSDDDLARLVQLRR
ncbi:DEAD/DEAH box helicase [Aeromicrobium sp. Leaf350]|uniref:DEAD/DEAH box helicase n=1 Tax=Aeromicrobium sp. Leaf350 TaxID=2876565 RepID=UPI001E3BFC8D|nr:DEAD/DEAH box helicase [Aeromicrobium sp. Leaf350]